MHPRRWVVTLPGPLTLRRVEGLGPTGAKLAIVGEAPGADEERLGQPFVGASGRMLDQMLAAVGIDRRSCYVTNVAKVRPPGNDFIARYYADPKRLYPSADLTGCIHDLQSELLLRKPTCTVALGEEALRAVTGRRGIGDWRGSIVGTPTGKCVATYHPAAVLRKYEWRRIVEHDLRRARDEATSATLVLPTREAVVDPSFLQAMDFLRDLSAHKGRVAWDIETLGPRVRCLSIAPNPHVAMCIPFCSCRRSYADLPVGSASIPVPNEHPFGSHWELHEEEALLAELAAVLGDPKIEKILQNAPFDIGIIEREFGIVTRGLVGDTMVKQHCCYCELPKGLDFLCSFYTRTPCYWQYDAASDAQTWVYCCYDSMVTYECNDALDKEMKELGV
jgi:DNA polymerase